jgi:hypothetical protein
MAIESPAHLQWRSCGKASGATTQGGRTQRTENGRQNKYRPYFIKRGHNPQNINYTGKQEDGSVLHVTNAVRGMTSPTFLCHF